MGVDAVSVERRAMPEVSRLSRIATVGSLAVGAYMAAILITGRIGGVHTQPVLAVIAGGLAAAVLGVIVGVPSLRLAGPYLAVVTLSRSVPSQIH